VRRFQHIGDEARQATNGATGDAGQGCWPGMRPIGLFQLDKHVFT
jgi:hypothetical protein